MSVAVLPRPEPIKILGPRICPHRGPDLDRWDPSWLSPDGVITIPAGTRALIRGNKDIPSDLLIRELWIPATSELIFEDRNSTFRVRDIRVAGALRLGSPDCRLRERIEFYFDTEEDVADPEVRQQIYDRAGLGIVVEPGGVIEAFGALYQPTWTRLAATAAAGSSVIQLAERVDWRPGQEVVVVTSARRDYPFLNQNEVRTIAAVPDKTTLVLDAPLEYLHYGGPEYQVEVGLLSRNIVFQTAQAVLDAAPNFGGHIMVNGAEARISGVEVRGLGQQNFLGRYPLHLHILGDVAGNSYFTDNSIRDSNWRCAVVHRTDNAVVSRNVAYNTWGHCYYLEDGTEEGNEISFNLAAGVKIMGPVDQASLDALNVPTQQGFTLNQSSDFANPADRAAAGFYIPNGNNQIFGNASSGGFAGYSFPNLPEAIGGGGPAPLDAPISHFDGNSAHTAGYFWPSSGCVYVGGVLQVVDEGGGPMLQYNSGRSFGALLRDSEDHFSNTKTFLCEAGVRHWGHQPRIVNLEAWDVGLMAQVFGSASIQSAIVAGQTGNTANLIHRPLNFYQRGFRFYDTDTRTILKGIVFRNFHEDPLAGPRRSQDSCAMASLSHSDQFTPQRMSATAELYFDNVDHAQRLCHDDSGTLSSRNFNINDTDGSASRVAGDGLPPGPRIIGSGHTDIWRTNDDCLYDDDWGLWICPQQGTQNVASIATFPNADVQVDMYDLEGNLLGENWYSATHYEEAQITGPSETLWHHSFPGGAPASFDLHVKQVPADSFALYSFALPPASSCSITGAGWQSVADLDALLSTDGAAFTTEVDTCFIRIPPANQGFFESAGLSTPFQTWRGFSPLTSFTVEVVW